MADLANRLSETLQQFGSVAQDIRLRLDQRLMNQEEIVYLPLHTFMLNDAWHQARVVLLGDAIHTTISHLDSATGLAIEGTLIFSEQLANDQAVEDALFHYRCRHFQHAKYVIDVSTHLGELEIEHSSIQAHQTLMKPTIHRLPLSVFNEYTIQGIPP